MIEKLKGTVVEKTPEALVLHVGGIFFKVNITLNAYRSIPEPGNEATVEVDLIFSEKGVEIYGFSNREEKEFFRTLRTVNGIGPRKARILLSGIPLKDLIDAIERGDSKFLSRVPGIGQKSAERIIFELKRIIPEKEKETFHPFQKDAIQALVNLGFRKVEAENVVREIWEDGKSLEELIREGLKKLVKI